MLGGTVFLSRAVAAEAVRRGHDVTCACRGESGQVPDDATHLAWDRSGPVPPQLARAEFDAVVDVTRRPSWARAAVAAFPNAHWVFVSTMNVYADDSSPGGSPATLPVHDPIHTDEDPAAGAEVYGAMKVACELIVAAGTDSSMVVRPGLIVGPGDPSGRLAYWAARLGDADAHPEVLAPGSPEDAVQMIDVRDLATWIVQSAESRRVGVFDASAHPTTRGEFLTETFDAAPATTTLTWVDQPFLQAHDVAPWMGPRSVPLWLPLPEYAGLMSHDVRASYDAGLRTRPSGESVVDTLAWLREHPDAAVTGLARAEEAEVLAAWHASGA